jgi:sec-independent protein translocase protein TatB
MSFSDTIFLFFLALILFGPKKLPGMARQAGRLLAELRRASNEFKSQIETEIAHLEVEKAQTALPPSPPPQGTVASLSPTPAVIDSDSHHLDVPSSVETPSEPAAPADSNLASSSSTAPSEAVTESIATSQESHV